MNPMFDYERFDPYSFPVPPAWFHRPESIHGVSHTRRVLIHAYTLAGTLALDLTEFAALVFAAAWHDIGRTHDGRDRDHGAKSVARVKQLGLDRDISPEILERAFFAVEFHSTDDALGREYGNCMPDADSLLHVLWVLKDADGLDRVRINDVDVSQLRFAASGIRIDDAWTLYRRMP